MHQRRPEHTLRIESVPVVVLLLFILRVMDPKNAAVESSSRVDFISERRTAVLKCVSRVKHTFQLEDLPFHRISDIRLDGPTTLLVYLLLNT